METRRADRAADRNLSPTGCSSKQQEIRQDDKPFTIDDTSVERNYFEASKIPIVDGRTIAPADTKDTPLMQSLLYDVSTFDPLSSLAGALVLTLAALAANVLPALTASRDDPMRALRQTDSRKQRSTVQNTRAKQILLEPSRGGS